MLICLGKGAEQKGDGVLMKGRGFVSAGLCMGPCWSGYLDRNLTCVSGYGKSLKRFAITRDTGEIPVQISTPAGTHTEPSRHKTPALHENSISLLFCTFAQAYQHVCPSLHPTVFRSSRLSAITRDIGLYFCQSRSVCFLISHTSQPACLPGGLS